MSLVRQVYATEPACLCPADHFHDATELGTVQLDADRGRHVLPVVEVLAKDKFLHSFLDGNITRDKIRMQRGDCVGNLNGGQGSSQGLGPRVR